MKKMKFAIGAALGLALAITATKADATIIYETSFLAADGFSDGTAIEGVDNWDSADSPSPNWIAQDTTGAGRIETTNSATDVRTIQNQFGGPGTSGIDGYLYTVDFSILGGVDDYTSDSDLFSFGIARSPSNANSGFGVGARVKWIADTNSFQLLGRDGGSVAGRGSITNTTGDLTTATAWVKIVESTTAANEFDITYSFNNFATSGSFTDPNAGLAADEGTFLQIISEDAAKNGGAGIAINAVTIETIPEPSTLVLSTLISISIAFVRRQRMVS